MPDRRVFISVANREHERFRAQLRDNLVRADITAIVQPDFPHTATDTLTKLDDLIAPCDLLVHIVGRDPGTRAGPDAVAAFFRRTPRDAFLEKHPDARLALGDFSDLSYFQWEPWLALHRDIDTIVYAEPGHAEESFPQRTHLDALKSTLHHADTLKDSEERSAQIVADVCRHFGVAPPPTTQKISPPTFLHHTAEHFLGRDTELALLDTAWANAQHTENPTNLLSLIAWGGVGKTALLAHWVQTRFVDHSWQAPDGSPHPHAYFDWSFYDQGTASTDDKETVRTGSVGDFFERALTFFGDPDPNAPGKGARLAELVRAQQTLLLLDGLEPLQHPPNHLQAGRLLDPDLRDLLTALAHHNPGLCIATSRQPLADLTPSDAAPQERLTELPIDTAVRLLRKLQVTGTDDELAEAAEALGRHALSLTLLGRYLFDAHGGDIRQHKHIDLHTADDATRPDRHRTAWKILEVYDAWLTTDGTRPEEHAVLRLLGLFDRPATPGCLKALREEPAIPSLTEHLTPLNDPAWRILLNRLQRAGLITLRSTADNPTPSIDAHPLVREYFAHQLKTTNPKAFREAHSRLFDHLCATTEHQPDTLEALQPLYQAVTHGCHAGRHQKAVADVYRDRILRGTGPGGNYSTFKLGAISADLGAVAAFFERPWDGLSTNLAAPDQAWLLNEAAYSLRALGRLTEALQPMRAALEMAVTSKAWKPAAIRAGNLSELHLTIGHLTAAVADATRAIDFADRSRDAFQRISKCTTAADAHHQSGDPAAARNLFAEAEALQREHQPQLPLLYSIAGFRYCDLLLAPAEQAAWRAHLTAIPAAPQDLTEVERRAGQTLEIATSNSWLLDIALDHLTLARVVLYRIILTTTPNPNSHLAAALDTLRQANSLNHLPKALLTAALHHHLAGDPTLAEQHLAEAQLIAERGPMPLHLADVHLHRARLTRDKSELDRAATLIKKHAYNRRLPELQDAQAAATSW